MPTRAPPSDRPPSTRTVERPLGSFLLRIVVERTVRVARVYELHDIATGKRHRFATLAALQRHLARQAPG
jgi:hypothetical protein